MSFIEQLRPASFRGLAFSLSENAKSFGRDVKKHKIINSRPRYEDTGEKEDTFTIEAAVGGNDNFLAEADAFEKALSQKGPGRLVLPQTGELTVVVTEARRRESSTEVGIVYFSITFEIDESPSSSFGAFGAASISSATKLQSGALALWDAGLSDFLKSYKSAVPDFILDSTGNQMDDFLSDLSTALSRIGQDFKAPDFTMSSAESFGNEIISLFKDLADYEEVLDFSVGTTTQTTSTIAPLSMVSALTSISGELIDVSATSNAATDSTRAGNLQATDLFTKISAAAAAAQAVSYADYESKQEAITLRDNLMNALQMLRTASGEEGWINSYKALGTLMAAVNRDIDEEIGRLPATVTVDSQAVRSSFVLAHRIYGNTPGRVIAMASDIVKRNGIIHPSFIPEEKLEVLADV